MKKKSKRCLIYNACFEQKWRVNLLFGTHAHAIESVFAVSFSWRFEYRCRNQHDTNSSFVIARQCSFYLCNIRTLKSPLVMSWLIENWKSMKRSLVHFILRQGWRFLTRRLPFSLIKVHFNIPRAALAYVYVELDSLSPFLALCPRHENSRLLSFSLVVALRINEGAHWKAIWLKDFFSY